MLKAKIIGAIIVAVFIIFSIFSFGAIFLLSEKGGMDLDAIDETFELAEDSESDDGVVTDESGSESGGGLEEKLDGVTSEE